MLVTSLMAALLVGFLAGLFSFKVKTHWCPGCGTDLRCPVCRPTAPNSGRWR
jgi:hypothetical protein